MEEKVVLGFSKLSKNQKLKWLATNFDTNHGDIVDVCRSFYINENVQKIIDGFSENTISNFVLPYGLAPNFLIDGEIYCVPMVIEESSVVAAASSAAKYWLDKGGFKTTILGTIKVGQVHFKWSGPYDLLYSLFNEIEAVLIKDAAPITENMVNRGGGIVKIELLNFNDVENSNNVFLSHSIFINI